MKLQLTLDKSAMGLSLACLAHCLVLPAVLVLLPVMLAAPLGDELFHQVLLFAVVSISAIALVMGCQKHRVWSVLAWGIAGLAVLIVAGVFGHDLFGDTGEKIASVLGSALIIVSHYKNYRLCGTNRCEC